MGVGIKKKCMLRRLGPFNMSCSHRITSGNLKTKKLPGTIAFKGAIKYKIFIVNTHVGLRFDEMNLNMVSLSCDTVTFKHHIYSVNTSDYEKI